MKTKKRWMFCFFLLFQIVFIKCQNITGSNICEEIENLEKITDEEVIIQKLYDHCVIDERCAHFFNIDMPFKNKTVFKRLVEPILFDLEMDYLRPIKSLCDSNDLSELNALLWPNTMISRLGERFESCPPNFMRFMDSELRVSCVCSADSDCNEPSEPIEAIIILLSIIILFLLVIFVIVSIILFIFYRKNIKQNVIPKEDEKIIKDFDIEFMLNDLDKMNGGNEFNTIDNQNGLTMRKNVYITNDPIEGLN